MRRHLLLTLAVLMAPACFSDVTSQQPDRSGDVDALLQLVRQQHIIYREAPLPASLRIAGAEIQARAAKLGDERLLAELQRLLARLGDGHSYVMPWGADRVVAAALPLRLYLFDDGLYVTDAREGYEHLVGSRVVRIHDRSAEDLMEAVAPFVSRDAEMGVRWIGPILLSFRGFLEAILEREVGGTIDVELRGRDGQQILQLPFLSFPVIRGLPKLTAPPESIRHGTSHGSEFLSGWNGSPGCRPRSCICRSIRWRTPARSRCRRSPPELRERSRLTGSERSSWTFGTTTAAAWNSGSGSNAC